MIGPPLTSRNIAEIGAAQLINYSWVYLSLCRRCKLIIVCHQWAFSTNCKPRVRASGVALQAVSVLGDVDIFQQQVAY